MPKKEAPKVEEVPSENPAPFALAIEQRKAGLANSIRLVESLKPIDPTFIGMAPDEATAELLTIGKLHLSTLIEIIADKDKALAKAELDLGDFALALQEYSNETGGQLVFQNFQLCLDMIRNRRKG